MKKIFLIGMPGSGKTTIGQKLAEKLSIPFFDLDEIIEEKTGSTIDEIFSREGEEFFRKLESKYLEEVINNYSSFVLSTGGGTPCFHQNMELIKKSGISVYLDVSAEELNRRLLPGISHRPLLKNKSEEELLEEIKNKLNVRSFYYKQSDHLIINDNINVDSILAVLEEKS